MKIFNTREEFIQSLPHNGIIAEVGVEAGLFSESIILATQPQEMHLIDHWEGNSEPYYNIAVERFAIVRGHSIDVVKTYPDRYFDCIYLDAGHEYENVLADLEAWHHKVKIGGVLCGHDYSKGTHCWIQVAEALEKWMPENGYAELDYLTMEDPIGITPSWGLIVKQIKGKN